MKFGLAQLQAVLEKSYPQKSVQRVNVLLQLYTELRPNRSCNMPCRYIASNTHKLKTDADATGLRRGALVGAPQRALQQGVLRLHGSLYN